MTEGVFKAIPWVLQGIEGFVLDPQRARPARLRGSAWAAVTARSVTQEKGPVRPAGRTAQPARKFPSPSTFASFSGPPLRHRQRNRWPPRALSTGRVAAGASTQRHPSPRSPGFPPSTERLSRSSNPRMGGPFEASASSPTRRFRCGGARRPSRRRWAAARSPSCWRDPSTRRIGSGASGHPSRRAGCPPALASLPRGEYGLEGATNRPRVPRVQTLTLGRLRRRPNPPRPVAEGRPNRIGVPGVGFEAQPRRGLQAEPRQGRPPAVRQAQATGGDRVWEAIETLPHHAKEAGHAEVLAKPGLGHGSSSDREKITLSDRCSMNSLRTDFFRVP